MGSLVGVGGGVSGVIGGGGWVSGVIVVFACVYRPSPDVPTSVWPTTCWKLFRGYPAISCCFRVGHAH